MKIVQIARKLSVHPNKIIRFLKINFDFLVAPLPATPIDEKYLESIVQHFTSPTLNTEIKPIKKGKVWEVDESLSIEGFKVVDKIKLPKESKKTTSKKRNATKNKPSNKNTNSPNKEKKRNSKTISVEQRKKNESEQLIKERKRKKEEEKKRKRKNYQRMVKEANNQRINTTKKKSSKQKAAEKQEIQQIEEPQTIWGKFIKWLNT